MRTNVFSISVSAADSRGFTLVELMVAMVMAVIIIGATVGMVKNSSRIYRTQERVAEAQQDVRAALDLMAHDIRMAGYDPMRDTLGSVAGVVTATATTFRFTMDLNASGGIDAGVWEDITYDFDAANNRLRLLTDGANAQTLIENVTAMTFTYLDSDGATLGAPIDTNRITRVEISVQCSNRDAYQQGQTFERALDTNINSRNLSL